MNYNKMIDHTVLKADTPLETVKEFVMKQWNMVLQVFVLIHAMLLIVQTI